MLNRDQKLFGYAIVNSDWVEFDRWQLMEMSEVEYRKWKEKYEKRIHVTKDSDSPLVFFNRGHKTFSYFPNGNSSNQLGKTNKITLSHYLRQKVISEKKQACFSLKDKILRKNYEKTKIEIRYKRVQLDKPVEIDGAKLIPDIIIEFDEPAYLALKWKNKIFIEIAEKNETKGHKIEAYEKLGHGVIEIPPNKDFDVLKHKKINHISKEDVTKLIWKIRNYFKYVIWADLIVNPTSIEYLKFMVESVIINENKRMAEKNMQLSGQIEYLQGQEIEYKSKFNELSSIINVKNLEIEKLTSKLKKKNDEIVQKRKEISDLNNLIVVWNKKSVFNKLMKGFIIQST